MSKLVQLIYSSTSTKTLSVSDLEGILLRSRQNNTANELTGMLLYRQGSFIQVLEGPNEAVQSTYKRIEKDQRHKNVTCLYESNIVHRDFPDWAMAFNVFDADNLEGMSDFLHPLKSKDERKISPGAAKVLLSSFREINRR